MSETAEQFVAAWVRRNVMNIPTWSDYPEVVAGLARKLEQDAWGHGITRADFLAVVGRSTYEYLLDKVERKYQ